MKKLLLCSITIFIVLSLSCICFADGGGPSFAAFKALVTAENGTVYYDDLWSGTPIPNPIEYNTQINVLDSAYKDDVEYYAFIFPEEDAGDYGWYDKIKYIYIDDVAVDRVNTSIDDYIIHEQGSSMYAFAKDGIKIREFAVDNATVLGTIPLGTYFYGRRVAGVRGVTSYGEDTPWYYINYNNIKGFVYENYEGIGYSSDDDKELLLYKTQYLYSGPEKNEDDRLIEIPKNTIIRPIAYRGGYVFYVEYKGFKGFLFDVAYNRSTDYVIVWHEGANLYEEPDPSSEILESDIPVDTIMKSDWKNDNWRRVVYNGKTGWVKTTGSTLEYLVNNEEQEDSWYVTEKYLSRYVSSYSTDEYNELAFKYEEQQKGAVEPQEDSGEEIVYESPISLDSGSRYESGEIVDTSKEEIEFVPSESMMDQINREFLQKVIIGLSIAIILCVTALVSLVLINKKKKNK